MAYNSDRKVKELYSEESYVNAKTKVTGKIITFGDDKVGTVQVSIQEDYKMSGKWFAKKELNPTDLSCLNALASKLQMKALDLYNGALVYVPPSKKTGDPMADAIAASDESDDIPF